MHLTLFGTALSASLLLNGVYAYPGMGKGGSSHMDKMTRTLEEIKFKARADNDTFDSLELIGDLLTLQDSQLTPVGRSVKNIITNNEDPQSTDIYNKYAVPPKGSPACKADTCCIWQYLSNDMQKTFRGVSGRCTALARAAVRLGFHDAAGWSKNTGPGGGADGSLVLAPDELPRSDNKGLEEIVAQVKTWYGQYQAYGVGVADIIQMGAAVATVTCPLGPRIRSFVGRKDSSAPCTPGLLPGVTQSADALIKLFQDKTIQPHGLTALIGAHTTSQQRFVDVSRSGDPQDSTPGIWDVLFYKQMLTGTPPRVFKFQSDVVLSQDSRIAQEFGEFAADQEHWNEDYAREYVRLSMLGVYNINTMTECTKVLPPRVTSYVAPDQAIVDKWLQTTNHIQSIVDQLRGGGLLTGFLDLVSGIFKTVGSLFPFKLW